MGLALYALGETSGQEYAAAMAIGLVPGGKLLGKLGSFLGKVGSSAWRGAKHYASRAGGFLADKVRGLAARAKDWLNRKPKAACGCFTAATLVWTPAGAVPIGELDQGAEVWAAPDTGQASAAVPATVGAKIIIGEASLLRLTVRHADGSVETINTTDEHPFHVTASGEWTRADGLQPGDCLSTLSGQAEVLALSFGAQRVPVYNLSIPGSPTYYVGERGVWVHNCGFEINLGLHVLQSRHNWQNLGVSTLDEAAVILIEVVIHGVVANRPPSSRTLVFIQDANDSDQNRSATEARMRLTIHKKFGLGIMPVSMRIA